jgi:hypothetical protein
MGCGRASGRATGRASLTPSDRPCEQVVLEVIEEQVARGSRIYESGHFVVLVWGNSQRDLEAVERILSQARRFHPLEFLHDPHPGFPVPRPKAKAAHSTTARTVCVA